MNQFTPDIFQAFQSKLKVGNRRGVHLNAIPGNSRYKLDLSRLSAIFDSLPERFIIELLTIRNVNFKFSIHDKNIVQQELIPKRDSIYLNDYDEVEEEENPDLDEARQQALFKLSRNLENLIFQNEVVQSEKGVNTLGFGFPLLIRKDLSDGQISASPILIWSVKVKPSAEMNTWEISRTEDDPIYLNEVLINHLQNDSGVVLDAIPDGMLEDGKIDKPELLAICNRILEQLHIEQNLDFILNNYEPIPPIKTKLAYDKLLPKKGDGFITKSGIFSLFEVQKQNIINDYENLKSEFKPLETSAEKTNFQSITSIETDPSQQGILESLKTQSKILIQGPPGTGKSQTLTALLVNSLENKQKTIVVCEKQTALEVLHNSLKNKGLGDYCVMIKDSVADRKLVVDAVRNVIDQAQFKKSIQAYPESLKNEQLSAIENLKGKINAVHQKLNLDLVGNKNWTEIIGQMLSFEENKEPIDLNSISFEFNTKEFNSLIEIIEAGQPLFEKFEKYRSNYFYNPKKITTENAFTIQQKINDSFREYKNYWQEINELASQFESFYYTRRKAEFSNQLGQLNELLNESEVLTSTLSPHSDVFSEKTDGFFYKILSLFSSSKKNSIQSRKKLQEIGQKVKSLSLHSNFQSINISSDLWQNKLEFENYRQKIEESKTDFTTKIEQDFLNLDLLSFFDKNFTNSDSEKILARTKQLKNQIKQDAWINDTDFGLTFNEFKQKLKDILAEFDAYNSNPENPFLIGHNWFAFHILLTDSHKKCLELLYPVKDWKSSFLHAYFHLLLQKNADDNLDFREIEYQDLMKRITSFASTQKNFIEGFWGNAKRDAVKKFETAHKDLTVANLYNKRRSEKHSRLSLRQIAQKDIDLFTSFFPIILTTPDACCNLFQGRNFYFDNVVFDEASQLKLEDNLPAMLKGKNVIVAGDEHQMPPSNYFSKVFDGTLEDEDDLEDENQTINFKNSVLNIESLLDFALEFKFDKNHLDFHYRSKHPYLIDFSNHAFYNSRLKPLPALESKKPIEFIEVNGVFQDYTNEEEANAVIEILEKIEPKTDGRYPSVGIATFNITQRNFIKRKIIQKQNETENEEFREKITALESSGLFIKNLENIQGDERDIIIISTTYGRKKDGKFIQSFGPINHTKGYKLLNVIITRAKEKIYICNSIPAEFYTQYKEALEQEKSNHRRAVFYAYLAYCKAVSEGNENQRQEILKELSRFNAPHIVNKDASDNQFKSYIFRILKDRKPEANLTKEFKFGGYTVDILIEKENAQPIAVECMSKENYDDDLGYLEDIHKAKILEKAGFKYVRIWSQNCWQNLNAELQKLN